MLFHALALTQQVGKVSQLKQAHPYAVKIPVRTLQEAYAVVLAWFVA